MTKPPHHNENKMEALNFNEVSSPFGVGVNLNKKMKKSKKLQKNRPKKQKKGEFAQKSNKNFPKEEIKGRKS